VNELPTRGCTSEVSKKHQIKIIMCTADLDGQKQLTVVWGAYVESPCSGVQGQNPAVKAVTEAETLAFGRPMEAANLLHLPQSRNCRQREREREREREFIHHNDEYIITT